MTTTELLPLKVYPFTFKCFTVIDVCLTDGKNKGFMVYSVGDGNILIHDPKNLREEAVQLSTMMYTANPLYNVGTILIWLYVQLSNMIYTANPLYSVRTISVWLYVQLSNMIYTANPLYNVGTMLVWSYVQLSNMI